MMEDEPLQEDDYPIMDDEAAAAMDHLTLDEDLSDSEDEEASLSVEETAVSEVTNDQTANTIDSSDDEYAPASQVKARLQDTKTSGADSESDATPSTQAPKKGKAAQKRAKRAAAAAAATVEQEEGKFNCATCEGIFPSRTKLHQHIKEFPKHAALKTVASAGGAKGKKKGKR